MTLLISCGLPTMYFYMHMQLFSSIIMLRVNMIMCKIDPCLFVLVFSVIVNNVLMCRWKIFEWIYFMLVEYEWMFFKLQWRHHRITFYIWWDHTGRRRYISKKMSLKSSLFRLNECARHKHVEMFFQEVQCKRMRSIYNASEALVLVAIICNAGGNRSTRRKPPTCRKSLTNLIIYALHRVHHAMSDQ